MSSNQMRQWLVDRRTRLQQVALAVTFLILAGVIGGVSAQSGVVPSFTIEDVVVDQSVTIQTSNFPAGQEFVVTMGPNGSLGIDGTVVGRTFSGNGGSFNATYPIPANLLGAARIAIRLESPQGYFAYNWFDNNLTAEQEQQRIPSFTIESVDINESVTIQTSNFAPNRNYVALMGHMGTLGIDGIIVGNFNSGDGGRSLHTFPIPRELQGLERIAIRLESNVDFAYNWFDNQPQVAIPTPTMRVCAVIRDESVTIRTNSTFPPNREFAVLLNFMGTLGEGGYVVGTFNSGPTEVTEGTYPIPQGLRGLDQIAVRADEIGGPFFSYNYFDNQTAVFCGT